jgi:hypothetical protein
MGKLDKFETLNPYEQLFADDDLGKVKELEVDFGPRFSEICVFFGSNKCLNYLIEGGYKLSPLLNIYRLNRKEDILPFVSHPDELYNILIQGRYELLPLPSGEDDETRILKPSPHTALLTLIKLSFKHEFDMVDYASMILPLYTPEEWSRCVSESGPWVVSSLIKLEMFDLFNNSRLSHRTISAIKNATSNDRRKLKKRCSLPITYTLHKRRGIKTEDAYTRGLLRRIKASQCKAHPPAGPNPLDIFGIFS